MTESGTLEPQLQSRHTTHDPVNDSGFNSRQKFL